jgi:hypothetical protein
MSLLAEVGKKAVELGSNAVVAAGTLAGVALGLIVIKFGADTGIAVLDGFATALKVIVA